jgi:ubiquinone/menaquinone biosynthesis C-methylase UbiE
MTESGIVPLQRFVDPQTVSTHFHIREGDAVADFGAGSGFFVEVLARLVGSEGRVYACEIQKELVEKIGTLVRTKGLSMVDPLWCDLEKEKGVKIADGVLDVAIMVNTLFQFDEKEIAIREVHRTLRSGGKFFVIDWSESFGGLGPQPQQVVSLGNAQALVESQGFVYERSYDAGDHHYGLAFRKP